MRWCYVSRVAPGTRLLPLCLHLSFQDIDVNIFKLGSGTGVWGMSLGKCSRPSKLPLAPSAFPAPPGQYIQPEALSAQQDQKPKASPSHVLQAQLYAMLALAVGTLCQSPILLSAPPTPEAFPLPPEPGFLGSQCLCGGHRCLR